jgi:hypothetical protein
MMVEVDPQIKSDIDPSQLWRLRATEITRLMNEYPGSSPWRDRIRKPNAAKGQTVISERSFSTSLKPILQDGLMSTLGDQDIINWLTGYWAVIAELMPEAFDVPRNYAVQKTPGVYIFHMVAPSIYGLWTRGGQKGKAGIARILTDEEVREYFGKSDDWLSGENGGEFAKAVGMGGFNFLASAIRERLPQAEAPRIESMV